MRRSAPLKLLSAFLIRDFHTEVSYRIAFVAGIGGILFRLLIFYFLSQLISASGVPILTDYSGDYFSFVVVGIAFGSYFGVGLTSFARSLRREQTTGTLEAMMMTPAPIPWLIIGSASWSYIYTTFRVAVYLLIGSLLLGLDLSRVNLPVALVSLLLSVVAFASIGIIAASIIMVIKRGDPITALFSNAASLIGGVFYPVEILPPWLQTLANLLPVTYSLRAMRLALLKGASWLEVGPDLIALAIFCLLLFPASLIIFRMAVDRARADGSLSQY